MKIKTKKAAPISRPFFFPLLLAGILVVLFWKSFLPGYVHFANDGPLAQQEAAYLQLPGAFTGSWDDLNGIGINSGAYPLHISAFLRWVLGAVGYAKFYAPIAVFILGLGAWAFFRQLKLSPLAATLGGLAVMLNSAYFSTACWGVASQQIAVGMCYFALALVVSNSSETPTLIRWTHIALAGLAVGVNVMEGADNGAIYSLFVAAFVLVRALLEEGKPVWLKLSSGVTRIVVIAVFAVFIAAQTIVALVGVAIVGVAGAQQTPEAKAKNWDFTTQWSLPKVETFSLFVPGLFGYRMDTPKDASWLGESYQGGNYWGAMGRDPAWDRYFASGRQGSPPDANRFMRFSGGGGYQGILVSLIALWAIAQSFRRRDSVFSDSQRKLIWFWMSISVLTLLMSWGRFEPNFAPLYEIFYKYVPYSSTMRNPTKFISVFSWAWLILFAYGVHGLCRRYLEAPATNVKSSVAQFQSWWKNARGFDRKWTVGCGIAFAASVLAWGVYVSEKPALIQYLQTVGFGEDMAKDIAAFSIGQAGWFLLFFAAAILLCILVIAGIFSGKRARLGGILLGVLLLADLVRADLPWIIHWNYPQKYQSNPVVDFLRDKPYEHRVIALPFSAAPHLPMYDDYWEELYRIEWIQQLFPYYNIQSLDYVQNPRPPIDIVAFGEALAPSGTSDSLYLLTRNWELSNNRYFLGPMTTQLPMGNVDTLDFLNNGLDPKQKRFRIVQRFDVVPKEGVEQLHELEQFTVVTNDNGGCALFEFTGALPRAKLYSNWETNSLVESKGFSTNELSARDLEIFKSVGTNDFLTLKKLTSPAFDPQKTVLISAPIAESPPATNQNTGTVEFKSYTPKKIILDASAAAPSVLLLNDKYDSHWRIRVDGKPAELLRCNFIMRGVFVPAGNHTVEFDFSFSSKLLYVTLTAIGIGVLLCCFLVWSRCRADDVA